MPEKHSILVAYDDVTVQHAADTYYISVGDQQMINLTQPQMDALMAAIYALQSVLEG